MAMDAETYRQLRLDKWDVELGEMGVMYFANRKSDGLSIRHASKAKLEEILVTLGDDFGGDWNGWGD